MVPSITIRLDTALQRQFDRVRRRLKCSRSEIVRNALRRHLALLRFESARQALTPYAKKQGCLMDEDVFREVS